MNLTKTIISHRKYLQCKDRCGQVKQNHTWKRMHEKIGDNKIWYQNTANGLAYWTYWYYIGHIIASYCFQRLIELASLLSTISCYRFYILKDQQENMKVTIICQLATWPFYSYVVTEKKASKSKIIVTSYSLVNL